jgi:Flp pilus assembly protein TadG
VLQRTRLRSRGDSGVAAVELALTLPILVLFLGGMLDFGLAFHNQISLTHAAREGARVEAIGSGGGAATALAAYTPVAVTAVQATVVRQCPSNDGAAVRIEATYDFFILPFGDLNLRGEAVTRCYG